MPDLGLTDSLGQQAQAPQAAQSQGILGGLESILSHPLVQGALAAYLGGISTPRRFGLGTAIGQGGLAGLGQFSRAEELQQKLPLERAQVQYYTSRAETEKEKADAQQAMLKWLDTDPAALKMDPDQRAVLRLAVAGGYIQPGMLGLTPYQKQLAAQGQQKLDIAKQNAATHQTAEQARERYYQQEAAGLPALAAERQAAAAHSRAGVEAENATAALNRARVSEIAPMVAHTKAETTRLNQPPAGTEHLESAIDDPTRTAYTRSTIPDPGMRFGPIHPAKATDSTAEVGKRLSNLDKLRKDYAASLGPIARHRYSEGALHTYALSKGINPKTGEALPPLNPGWTWGPIDEDGTPHAIDPSGTSHHWED